MARDPKRDRKDAVGYVHYDLAHAWHSQGRSSLGSHFFPPLICLVQLLWGEEQDFYVLDSTAANYIFGRQAMSPSRAWQMHGCYNLGSAQYFEFPLDRGLHGCNDEWNSLDHRDPSSPVRNIIKSMFYMRENYPVLNDGYFLQQLSNRTRFIRLPGSKDTPTEMGIWSTSMYFQ